MRILSLYYPLLSFNPLLTLPIRGTAEPSVGYSSLLIPLRFSLFPSVQFSSPRKQLPIAKQFEDRPDDLLIRIRRAIPLILKRLSLRT